ncbi:lamin tail domain-containing protein [Bacillota bacterium Meth-B3]
MRWIKWRGRWPVPPWFVAAAAIALALSWFAQFRWLPGGLRLGEPRPVGAAAEIAPVGPVRIDEVMTSNRQAWAGAGGRYADWAELCNTGAQPIDITGWALTDRPDRKRPFRFPEQVLEPGERVLVYCTGDFRSAPGEVLEAPFRLSSTGDALLLYDARGAIMESLVIPALAADQVYARDERGAWRITDAYTPGLGNTDENHALLAEAAGASASPVTIHALCAWNRGLVRDADGDYCDWIELANTGDQPVSLKDYALSDDQGQPQRWALPDVKLEPGGRIRVFASGKDRRAPGGELHANFKLNAEGETVVLTDAEGRRIAEVAYELLGPDEIYARQADGGYQKTNG